MRLADALALFYTHPVMGNRTETIESGNRAPEFSLAAANRQGTFALSALLEQGTLIVEFLRGTW